jgi:hypothetical protein
MKIHRCAKLKTKCGLMQNRDFFPFEKVPGLDSRENLFKILKVLVGGFSLLGFRKVDRQRPVRSRYPVSRTYLHVDFAEK